MGGASTALESSQHGVCSSHFSAEDTHLLLESHKCTECTQSGAGSRTTPSLGPFTRKHKPRLFKVEDTALQYHWVLSQYLLRLTVFPNFFFFFLVHLSPAQFCGPHMPFTYLPDMSHISCQEREGNSENAGVQLPPLRAPSSQSMLCSFSKS